MYTLTRQSACSYVTVGLQVLQVRLFTLETKGLAFLGHGRGLLTDSEEFSDFNFCPAIEFSILSKKIVFSTKFDQLKDL